MTAPFNSVRQALAYAFKRREGPQAARQSYDRMPRAYRSTWDSSAVRACCAAAGVTVDSPEERELLEWLFCGGTRPTDVYKRVKAQLGQHGLIPDQDDVEVAYTKLDLVDVTWVDPETGEEWTTRGVGR